MARSQSNVDMKEYQLKTVPGDQFKGYSELEISSEEACAIQCLKDVGNGCASFAVEDVQSKRICKLGLVVENQTSEMEGAEMFVDRAGFYF